MHFNCYVIYAVTIMANNNKKEIATTAIHKSSSLSSCWKKGGSEVGGKTQPMVKEENKDLIIFAYNLFIESSKVLRIELKIKDEKKKKNAK